MTNKYIIISRDEKEPEGKQLMFWCIGKGEFKGEDGTIRNKLGYWSNFEDSLRDVVYGNIVKMTWILMMMKIFGVKARLSKLKKSGENLSK